MNETTVKVAVVEGNAITQTVDLRAAKQGRVVLIKAVPHAKYVLAEDAQGFGPENITVKRVGKDLHISLEGTSTDTAELVIQDFYGSEGELIGLGEDGQYHAYIASDAEDSHQVGALMDGSEAGEVLGYDHLSGFGAGLIAGPGANWLGAGLAALGAAVVGGGIAIAAGHNRGESSGSAPVNDEGATSPATAPDKPSIGSLTDNVGNEQGPVAQGGSTDDATPTLSGKGEPGDTITVTDNGQPIGQTVVDGNGNWSFTPDTPLADGGHSLAATETDPAGNVSAPSDPWVVTVDTVAPGAPSIGSLTDNVGDGQGPVANGGSTDDSTPTLSGKGEPGDTITVTDNGQPIGQTVVDGNGNWSFTPDTPLADGEHSFTATETDPAGNVSAPSDPFDFTVDTVAPGTPSIGSLTDNVGNEQGPVANGGSTDDSTPTLSGKGEPGDTITVTDNGQPIGQTVVDGNGNWSFTPDTPLADGEHSFTATETDPAGNVSAPSDPFDFTVDTVAPGTPAIGSLTDNVGNEQGPVANGGSTDDSTPTLSGKGEPGDTITVTDNGQPIGQTVVDGNGNWSFTPDTPLADGEHSFTATETDPAGNVSAPSDPFDFTVQMPATTLIETWETNASATSTSFTGSSGLQVSSASDMQIIQPNSPLQTGIFGNETLWVGQDSLATFTIPGQGTNAVSMDLTGIGGGGALGSDVINFYSDSGELLGTITATGAAASGAFKNYATYGSAHVYFEAPAGKEIGYFTFDTKGDGGGAYVDQIATGASATANAPDPGFTVFSNVTAVTQTAGFVAMDRMMTMDTSDPLAVTAQDDPASGTTVTDTGGQATQDGATDPAVIDSTSNAAPSTEGQPADAETVVMVDADQPQGEVTLTQGADGFGTLKLGDANQVLDFSALHGKVGAVELVDITGKGDNTLKLSVNDVLEHGGKDLFVSDNNVQMMVKGDSSDTVELSHLLPDGTDAGKWANEGTTALDGVTYNVYHNASLNAEVLVQQDVTTHV